MPTIIETLWGPRSISEAPHWHLVGDSYLFYNNVRAGKGVLLSVSAAIEAEPHLQHAQTPYSFARRDDAKEALFEEIRRLRYPFRPSRLKSLYAFDDPALVTRAASEWSGYQEKAVHECRIVVGAVTHRADATWLNSLPDEWEDAAHDYWRGTMTEAPFPEVLVHGAIFFPDWESFIVP